VPIKIIGTTLTRNKETNYLMNRCWLTQRFNIVHNLKLQILFYFQQLFKKNTIYNHETGANMRILFLFMTFLLWTNYTSAQNKVKDLELPANAEIDAAKRAHTVEGKCQGLIKWFVTSDTKTKYTINETKNSITINLPPTGNVHVIAIGIIEGKPTEFATTKITVKGEEKKLPLVEKKPPTLYLFVDFKTISEKNLNLFDTLYQNKKINFVCNDLSSPMLTQSKFSELYQQINSNSLLVVEDENGKIILWQTVPNNDQELLEIVKRYS
jgi:hypothetical protein